MNNFLSIITELIYAIGYVIGVIIGIGTVFWLWVVLVTLFIGIPIGLGITIVNALL